jgi:hypothetical protein
MARSPHPANSLPCKRGRVGVGAFAALALFTAPALANDSSAELATGGLAFVQNPNVTMRSEQLFLSMDEVRVTYHFMNNSDQPVTNLVAFPLPDITIADQNTNIAVPTEEPVNFVAFATTTDGQKVTTEVEQKAFVNGVEQTEFLRQLGIPLAPQLQSTYKALDALPKDKWQSLIDRGLGEIVEYGNTPDLKMQQHLEPRWTLKTTYFWQQTFPPHRDLVIEHRYKPSVGSSAGTEVGNPKSADGTGDYAKKYCMDSGFVASATRAYAAAQHAKGILAEHRLDYILSTGANWAGPIADFTLTIDKGDPANLISFCGNGVKKMSPTEFQVHYTDYTPKSDLAVLILQPVKEP